MCEPEKKASDAKNVLYILISNNLFQMHNLRSLLCYMLRLWSWVVAQCSLEVVRFGGMRFFHLQV